MTFDHYLTAALDNQPITITSDWGQGRTTFGGLSAALLLHKITALVEAETELRSLNVSFCGPLNTEEPCELNVNALRLGKSIVHYQGQVMQAGELATLVNACFGQSRASHIAITPPTKTLIEAGVGQRIPYIKGLTPEFTRHIDFAYSAGGMPFTNSKINHIHGWMRFKDCQSMLTNAHLVALIDAWPPAIIQKLKGPAPCATVTWSLDFITPLSQLKQPLNGLDWLWYEVNIEAAAGGYGHTQACIFHADGTPLALSRQLVVAYEKV